MLTRMLGARDFWNTYKDWVWVAVPVIGFLLALPALSLVPSEIGWCRERNGRLPVSEDEFHHCLAAARAYHYTNHLLMTAPLAALAYVIVFFTARGEAARRGLTLTFGGLADAYFVWLALLSSLADFFATAIVLRLAGLYPL